MGTQRGNGGATAHRTTISKKFFVALENFFDADFPLKTGAARRVRATDRPEEGIARGRRRAKIRGVKSMCVKAIKIDHGSQELFFRVLDLLTEEKRCRVRIDLERIAEELGTTVKVVSYNIGKLIKLGYIRHCGINGYEPTEKVLFLQNQEA